MKSFSYLIVGIACVLGLSLSACRSLPPANNDYVEYSHGPTVIPHTGSHYLYTYLATRSGDNDTIKLTEKATVVEAGSALNGHDSAFSIVRVSDTVNHFTTSGEEDYSALQNGDLKYLSNACNPYALPFGTASGDTIYTRKIPVKTVNGKEYTSTYSGHTEFAGMELVDVGDRTYSAAKVRRFLHFTFIPTSGTDTLHYTTIHTYYYSPAIGFFIRETEDAEGTWPGCKDGECHYERQLLSYK